MNPKSFPLQENKAFALVITLIMLVLAAGIAVGLLTSASLDRGTSRAGFDRYQADLAVQNGLEAAKKALLGSPAASTSVTNDDTFLVIRIEGSVMPLTPAPAANPTPSYYYLAKAQPGNAGKMDYYPLFSGGGPVTNQTIDLTAGATRAVATPTPPPNPTSTDAKAAIQTDSSKTKVLKTYPELSPWLGAVSTQWIEVVDPNDTGVNGNHNLPYQRYSFWIEDLGGYIDASVAGNTDSAGNKNKRPRDQSTAAKRYITTPSELALFTLFDPAPTTDSGATGAQFLIGNRDMQLTTSTLKQVAPALATPDIISPNLAVRVIYDSEQALVPYGYGYHDEGSQSAMRLQLNDQVRTGGDAAVQAIAQKINLNLPNFASVRKGGLTVSDYVNTIAASMIDYADADSNATVGSDYRGYDSYPLVNELYTMKWWTGTHLNPATNTYFVTISMDTWLELWNPSDQSVVGTAEVDLTEDSPVKIGNYSYNFGIKNADLKNSSTATTAYPSGGTSVASLAVNMAPNEYTVYPIRKDVFDYNTGVSPPLIFPPPPAPGESPHKLPISDSMTTNYSLSWKGASGTAAIVDKAAGGVQRLGGSLDGPNNYTLVSHKRWSGAYSGFSYTDDPAFAFVKFTSPGDPRASYYIGSPPTPSSSPAAQATVAYAQGSSFWVRNNRPSVQTSQIYAAVKLTSWPDRGHDTALVQTAPPTSPVAQAVADPPTSRPAAAANEPTKAPVSISNSGSYSNLAELGNIFDPAQWNITPDTNNRWTDITNTTSPDFRYGGGLSLRIGRPEFTRFDQPGARAWQLLDLLSVTSRIDTRGFVNINTASREALRTLGAGVLLNRDGDVQDDSTSPSTSLKDKVYPPFQSLQADKFADFIMAQRPFLSPAQLASLKTTASPPLSFFGNPAVWTGTGANQPSEWNDSGREEYFAKVLPLTSVRSRNFRVFVTGQELDKTGHVQSTLSKAFNVFLNPSRDASGKVTAQKVDILYAYELR